MSKLTKSVLILGFTLFSVSNAVAQADTLAKSGKKFIRPAVQIGTTCFKDTILIDSLKKRREFVIVNLDSLKNQKQVVVVNIADPFKPLLADYEILSYTATLINKGGPVKQTIMSYSFTPVLPLLQDLQLPAFILLSDIRCKTPNGIVYLDHVISMLK